MAGKKYRISKVAAELNVSYKSLIEHLNANGFEVEEKMTAKIDGDMYNVLLKEYAKDKQAKEESKALEINIRKKDETLTAPTNKKETKKSKDQGFEEVILIKDTGLSHGAPKEAPVEKKVEEPKPQAKEEPKEEESKKTTPEVKDKTPEKKVELPGLKVLGKVDLDGKEKEASKPKEKAPEKVEKPVIEDQKEEASKPVEKEAPKAKKPADVKEERQKEEEKKGEKEEDAEEKVVKTQYSKLGGLTIKGKIELPDPPKKKKPVASSQGKPGENDRKKRKRKRVDGRGPGRRDGGKKEEPREITEKEIQDKIKATLAKLGGNKGGGKGGSRSKMRKQKREDHKQSREEAKLQEEKESKILKVTEFVTANELASLMDVGVNEVITACFSLGMMVSINQRLDAETIQIVAEEFGYEVSFVGAEEQVEFVEEEDREEDLKPRAPIVTVMGHVDHGKTSLLDYVRSANVIAGEAGGITQHVAAYEVELSSGKHITFVDTPGHEAFTAMRARGAKVTDVVIIVIAADDRVMPQTKEAISHAQAAGVPIVFALNKIDKETANPDKIREELSKMNILVEEWGGKYQCQEISAKKGTNVDELLEKVLLESELLELKANPDKRAKGTVMEARLDKGRGILASVLVQEGTLSIGDPLVAGPHFCRVKAMFDERGKNVSVAGPSDPVNVLGFSSAPTAGDIFQVFATEQEAKDLSTKRSQLQRQQEIKAQRRITLTDIGNRLAVGNFQELKIIVKADVDGSAEALSDALLKLSTKEIEVNVIQKSVGQISETDVNLAIASDAIIIGFQVRPSANARKLAEKEEVDVRLYSVIYKAIDEVKAAMEGMLAPEFEEEVTGNAEVREVFKISKVGTIAGCMITDGKVYRDSMIRLIREGVVVYTGELASLKRFKDDVKEVNKGYECGLQIKNYNDLKEGDVIECYREVEVKRTL
jgi:translation initiation factor IF-2